MGKKHRNFSDSDREQAVSQLLTILAQLDSAGQLDAALHVNMALEILAPSDPRVKPVDPFRSVD